MLLGYKDSPVDEARQRFAAMLPPLLDTFLGHAPCVAAAVGGAVEAALVVPSTTRPGRSPLQAVEGLSRVVRIRLPGVAWAPGDLVRGSAPVGHMRPHAAAFGVRPGVRDHVVARRVLLLDDLYVSGARAQSAAMALRLAGARRVVVVALGRLLRPDRSARHAAFAERFDRPEVAAGPEPGPQPCCRCTQVPTSMGELTPVSSSEACQSAPASSPSRARADGRVERGGPTSPPRRAGAMY
jgi:hypothetical protein